MDTHFTSQGAKKREKKMLYTKVVQPKKKWHKQAKKMGKKEKQRKSVKKEK